MPDRPLLSMPAPTRTTPAGRPSFSSANVRVPTLQRQLEKLGPKFERLSQVLPDPQQLAELQADPAAIAPERALVFVIASSVVDFDRARRNVPGLEFLGEDEEDVPSDDDFAIEERPDKPVHRRIYFTMPDARALAEIVSLWGRYQRGEALPRGKTEWKKVFAHLADIRPWGPQDRLRDETKNDWLIRLEQEPNEPIKFEVEFWFRTTAALREAAHRKLTQFVENANGRILDRSTIPEIRYDAALLEVRPEFVRNILDNPDIGLVAYDEVMILRPQSLVAAPHAGDFDELEDIQVVEAQIPPEAPMVALLDGMPMAQHDKLADRLIIDDPESFADRYGQASEQSHGTSMASLIIHGDLNAPNGTPVNRKIYVRPVLYPQAYGIDDRREMMPPDKLAIDLIWRCFIRMFVGEDGEEPTAPSVRIVNLSLGDQKRRFAGVLSPWAKLIDYLSWEHGVLILVSAGNVDDPILLDGVARLADYEAATPVERETILLRAILQNRSSRGLLTPSEGLNCLTIGASHTDAIAPNGQGALAVDPYESPFLPNLSSALGLGYMRGVKPEILLPGGREHVRANSSMAPIDVRPVERPGRFFGIGAAAPGQAGETSKKLNFSGTSVATALATHSALKILEALGEIPDEAPYPTVDQAYYAVVLKALLVHAAKWDDDLAEKIEGISRELQNTFWEHRREDATRFLGFGSVDVQRVLECTEKRATLIGWGTIHAKQYDEFRVPLPAQLENTAGYRAVTATVGWLSPLNTAHRMYRMAKFEVEPGSDKGLSLGVENVKSQPSHNAFGKGTVFHRRWHGEEAKAFVDGGDLVLKVGCKPAAGDMDDAIPYGIAVTLEVGEDVQVPVYEQIRERLRERIAVPVRG